MRSVWLGFLIAIRLGNCDFSIWALKPGAEGYLAGVFNREACVFSFLARCRVP